MLKTIYVPIPAYNYFQGLKLLAKTETPVQLQLSYSLPVCTIGKAGLAVADSSNNYQS